MFFSPCKRFPSVDEEAVVAVAKSSSSIGCGCGSGADGAPPVARPPFDSLLSGEELNTFWGNDKLVLSQALVAVREGDEEKTVLG